MTTEGIIPAAKPHVPVTKHPSGVYGAECKVEGCDWPPLCSEIRAAVDEQASYHRHQHVAAHGRQLVAAAISGGAV